MQKRSFQTRSVYFKGSQEELLAASLDYPGGVEPEQYVIVTHCFTCTRQTITTARLSRGLAQAGFGVLRLDFTGLGESEGSFADSHFRSMVADIECAAEFLDKHFKPATALIGHSMGGTAGLAASQTGIKALASVKKLVTIASPAYPAHVLHHFGPVLETLKQGQDAEITVAGQSYPVKPAFVKDLESYDMGQQMMNCNLPIMAIRAGKDQLVEPQAAEDILQYTSGEQLLYDIEEADHMFSDRSHSELLLKQLVKWLA